jgi:hypothetical protein
LAIELRRPRPFSRDDTPTSVQVRAEPGLSIGVDVDGLISMPRAAC